MINKLLDEINRGEVPNGYKKTNDVGIIPQDWLVYNLETLTKSSDYGTSEATNERIGYPVLRMGNLHEGKVINNDLVYLDMDKETFQKYKLNKKDLLINRTNSYELVGKAALFDLDGDYVCASYIVRFKINEDIILPEIVNYYINLPIAKNKIKALATKGVSQANLNPTVLKKYFKLPFPPQKSEQVKIKEILDTWNKIIKIKRKLLVKKIEFKNGLMQKLLTGKLRLNGFNQDWKTVKLGDVLKERTERGYENLELLSITSSKGVIKRSELDRKNTSSSDKSKYKRIKPLDIGYNTMRMWQGVCGVSEYEGIVSPAYTILNPTDQIDPYFMGYLFKLPEVINLFYRYSQGIVNDTLNLKYKHFKLIKVKIPADIEEQKEIAKILKTQDKEIELLKQEVEALKKQKKGLMQLLLTGKVRVNSKSYS